MLGFEGSTVGVGAGVLCNIVIVTVKSKVKLKWKWDLESEFNSTRSQPGKFTPQEGKLSLQGLG